MDTSDLGRLPLDQQQLVHSVTSRLQTEFSGTFGPETIERFVVDSLEQLLPTAKITSFLPVLAERFARACTTPAAPRWPPAGCATSPAIV